MSDICVNNAEVLISAEAPAILISNFSTTVPASTGQTITSISGNKVLMEADFETWVLTYMAMYTSAAFTIPGTLTGMEISLSDLSTETNINGQPVVLTKTTGTITVIAEPAEMPPPVSTPDPNPPTSLKLEITSASQTIATSN